MTKTRNRSAVAAAALSVIVFAACGAADGATAQSNAPVKIRLGWQTIPMAAANYLMAQDAAKYGLDIELVPFNRYSDMRIALQNGSIDFGTLGPTDVIVAADTGRPNLVVVAGQALGGDLIAKKAGIGKLSWQDIASGKLAFGSFGAGIAWIKTVATMDELGLDYGKVNEIKIAGTIYDVMQVLKTGGTQVTMNVDPAIAQAVQEGYAEYADELDINKSSLGGQNSLFAANKSMLDRPDVLRKVLEDYVYETERLQKDQNLWATTYQGYTGVDKAVADMSLKRVHLDLSFSQDSLRKFATFMLNKGIVQTPSLPGTVTNLYLYEPLAEITGKSPKDLGESQ